MKHEPAQIEMPHFTVQIPEQLERVTADLAELVLAFREDDGQFRPNIVFTVEEHAAPLSDAAMRVLQLAPEVHKHVVFPTVDLWGADLEARRITMLYPTETATDVCVRQWVWATGTHHVHATASYLPFQWQWAEPLFEQVVHSMTIHEPVAPQLLDAPTEFPLDTELSAVAGVALESFENLAPPAELRGMPVASSAIELLTRTASQLRFGGRTYRLPKDARGGADAQELERCGLAQGDTLGPFGESVGKTLAQGTVVADLAMIVGGRQATLTARAREDEVVIVRTGGTALAQGRAQLVVCGVEQVLRHIIEWIAVKPRHLRGEAHEFTLAQLQERFETPTADGGWRRIKVQVPDVATFDIVDTPEYGPLAVDRHNEAAGGVHFTTQPSGQLFEELRASIFERLSRAQGRLL